MNQRHKENMGAGHITGKNYITGFILAVVLTVISFGLVTTGAFSKQTAIIGLCVAAVMQMLVHLHYFLHLDRSSAERWNVVALLFTALLLFIFVAGTIWVMYTLNSRMR